MLSISSTVERSPLPMESPVVWKEEPVSPLAEEAEWLDSDWLSPQHLAASELDFGDLAPSGRELTADKLFIELEDLIKPEPYSNNNWYVDKTEAGVYDECIAMPDWGGEAERVFQQQQPAETQIPPSNFLLQELEDALTPPDSPKDEQLELVKSLLQEMRPLEGRKMEVSEWVEAAGESVCSGNSPEPWSSPQGGSSESSSGDDQEWTPFGSGDCIGGGLTSRTSHSLSRPKPYSRPPPSDEERKLRKKEQNKNAATRYRQKKKAQIEEILSEEKELADHNEKLKADVVELAREIKYLKSLMREFYQRNGLIK